jgi:hypothetical protein
MIRLRSLIVFNLEIIRNQARQISLCIRKHCCIRLNNCRPAVPGMGVAQVRVISNERG